jgi:ceramide glucosyltransferase
MVLKTILVVALAGISTSTIYLVLVFVAALRFRRRSKTVSAFTPPVSLLKPLYGAEPGLHEYLDSFFRLDYPEFEILFCARHDSDPGLLIAREVAERYPHVPVRFLASGEPTWPNARAYSLNAMKVAAKYDILVITDSDVRVTPGYLRAVVEPLREEETGLVTCLYRGVATGKGFWAHLEGLGMSVEMTSGVLVAEMLEGMRFALGPSMVVRRRCVDQIGGFQRLGDYYADDFMLGNLVWASGNAVVLSNYVVDHCVVNSKSTLSFAHQWNWMKSTRFSRPKGHLGTGLIFGVPFGLIALPAALRLGKFWFGLALFAWTFVARMAQSLFIGGFILRDRDAVRLAFLYPIRDLLGFVLWAASYMSRHVGWRDDRFELQRNGVIRILPVKRGQRRPTREFTQSKAGLASKGKHVAEQTHISASGN